MAERGKQTITFILGGIILLLVGLYNFWESSEILGTIATAVGLALLIAGLLSIKRSAPFKG